MRWWIGSSSRSQPGRGPEGDGRPGVGLGGLAVTLLRLGAVAFGGLGAALALLGRELVGRRGWLTQRDLSDALAFTKPLPGSMVVQVVAFVGWRLRGWPGALVASVCFIAPATMLMTVAAASSTALPDTPAVAGMLTGVQVAVVGLLGAAMWRLARSEANTRSLAATLVAAFAVGLFANPALVVVGAGIAGVLVCGRDGRG